MKLTIEIKIGNDAMRTPHDLAEAVLRASQGIRAGRGSGKIYDDNGNVVGFWEIRDKELKPSGISDQQDRLINS